MGCMVLHVGPPDWSMGLPRHSISPSGPNCYNYSASNLEFVQIESWGKIWGNILNYLCASKSVLIWLEAWLPARLRPFMYADASHWFEITVLWCFLLFLNPPVTFDYKAGFYVARCSVCFNTKFYSARCSLVLDGIPHSAFPAWAGVCFR